ncbi:MAG TPA: DUF1415 domain-containing protein [Candidatus Saccharimonadia bacterium]|nr:DUF1415 domain-containing protein [Candidatus Saccharimonadia bacterium]
MTTPEEVLETTRRWLERAVIGLDLCPFAKAVHARGAIRFVVSDARDAQALQAELERELVSLASTPPAEVETTLLIHPHALTDFLDYNDFLDVADATLAALGLEGEIQVASFHPAYQYANTSADDASNYTNRSPYPTLHLLREASVESAVAAHPDVAAIFERNIETMRKLGPDGWRTLFEDEP